MGDPKNATIGGDGFRFYRWVDPETGDETDLLSVTSIRKLCGEPFTLVNWQLANLADAALGTMKRTIIGPRGGVSEKRLVEEFPSEFASKYDATKGEQAKVDELRKWLREQADEPRNIAAIRGSITHEAIEKNVKYDRIERPYVEAAFERLSERDRKRAKKGVQDQDVAFVRNSMRQYWHMRAKVPFVILAQEVQVFNLTIGYGGSFDALVWFLGTFDEEGEFTPLLDVETIDIPKMPTLDDIKRIGGTIALLDWKTSKDVYTDQVVQAHAYMSAEFCGADGVVDHRLTDILQAAMFGGLVHIRPNGWGVHLFPYMEHVAYAFLGSVAFARFLATYPRPQPLFKSNLKGEAPEESDDD